MSLKIFVKGDPETNTLGDCPFCHRALLTLELKGLEHERGYIDFSNKPQWLFEVNPEGKVPVLQHGDKWVVDSGEIVKYLDDTFPGTLGEGQIPGVAEKLFPAFVQFLKASDEEAADKEAALLVQLKQLDEHLAKNGPYLCGEAMGGADAMLLPRLYHLTVALPYFRSWSVPEELTALRAYIDLCKGTEQFKKTDYGSDMIIKGWQAHMGQ